MLKQMSSAGIDSPGGDLLHLPDLHGDVARLRQRCQETEECVAFTSDGVLKHHIKRADQWTSLLAGEENQQGNQPGLYVAGENFSCINCLRLSEIKSLQFFRVALCNDNYRTQTILTIVYVDFISTMYHYNTYES